MDKATVKARIAIWNIGAMNRYFYFILLLVWRRTIIVRLVRSGWMLEKQLNSLYLSSLVTGRFLESILLRN